MESGEDVIVVKNKDGKKIEVLSKKSCPILDIVRRIGLGNNANNHESDLNIFNLLIEKKADLTLKRCIVSSMKTGNVKLIFRLVILIF